MSIKKNCWEFMNCGREPDGANAAKLGVCPSATEIKADGINGGINGGRACWGVAGTFCGGDIQATFAKEMKTCFKCDFHKKVVEEESLKFQSTGDIWESLSA